MIREREKSVFDKIGPPLLILDEAHYCKTVNALRTTAALGMARRSNRTWLLSGTPMPNDPRELWSVVKHLWPEIAQGFGITNQFQWMDRWCVWSQGEHGYRVWGLKPAARTQLIPALRRVMLRRKLTDVAIELPPLRTTVEWLPRNPKLAAELEALGAKPDEYISTVRRVLGSYKVGPIANQIIAEVKHGVHQTVVMYHHHATRDALRLAFDMAGIPVTGFDGSANAQTRQKAIDLFQNGGARIFLAQQTAAGIGITLTAASDIVLVEPSWSPEDNLQAIKRIHRIGQDKPCRARLFAVPGSVDAAIMESVARKMKMIGEVIG